MSVSPFQLSEWRTTAILLIATKRNVSTAQIRREYLANDKTTCAKVARFIEISLEVRKNCEIVKQGRIDTYA